MENSLGAGYMAVFAVSGSVVLLALQAHKRLLSDFMKKMEFEMGPVKGQQKKKVRFANGAVQPSSENKGSHPKKHQQARAAAAAGPSRADEEKLERMPRNWQALYKGILQSRALRGLY